MTDTMRENSIGACVAIAVLPWIEWIPRKRFLPAASLAAYEGGSLYLILNGFRSTAVERIVVSPNEVIVIALCLASVSILVRLMTAVGAWRRRLSPERTTSHLHRISRRVLSDPKGLTGLLVLGALAYIAVVAPLIATDPLVMDFGSSLRPPSAEHILGTDMYGRNLLSRIVFGARYSLGISVTATLLNVILGASLGLVAGFFRGAPDALIMRLFEILNSIPFLMLAILIVAVFGSSIPMLIIVLSVFVLQPARIVRGQVLELREKEYAQAAQALGASKGRIILHHVLPNVLPTLLVVTSVRVGQNILSLAGLSFLGMGITPPTPSWGSMLQEGREHILSAPWLGAFPGAAIFITVLAFNLLGDSLRDALDPRLGREW